MIEMSFLKISFAAIIFILTLCFGMIPLIRSNFEDFKDWSSAESLATGIFLGAGILHLLPDSSNAFAAAGFKYPIAFFLLMVSFFLLLLLEHIAKTLQHSQQSFLSQLALITTFMLSIHSFLEGGAVGVSGEIATAFFIFLAIIAHKGAAAFALAVQLQKGLLRKRNRYLAFACFALMTPLGIILGNVLSKNLIHIQIMIASINALAAGTFLYIGSLHGFERAPLIRYCCNMKEFFWMFFGFILMAVLSIWV